MVLARSAKEFMPPVALLQEGVCNLEQDEPPDEGGDEEDA